MLFFSVRAWYTIGRRHASTDNGELRCFKLNRFTAIELTDQGFEIPDDFSLDGYLGNAWRMIRGEHDHDVEIRFDPEFANTISETQWHRTQEVEFHDDGSATFRCTVSGLDEIVWWVLSMGPHCRVIQPETLAERVRDAAEAVARIYELPTELEPKVG